MTGFAAYRPVLAVAGLPALLSAAMLSRLAGRMLALAIVLYALDRFASPQLAGWLSFAAMAPGLAISPVTGVMLDRFGAAWGIALDLAVSAVMVGAMALTEGLGVAGPTSLLALVTVFSLTGPLSAAGVRTLLPRLVPAAMRDRANALDTAIFTVADLAGPAVAGALFGLLGATATFTAIAAMFGAAAACTIRIPVVTVIPPEGSMIRQTLGSVMLIVRHPTLRGLVICYGLYQIAWGILTILVPVCVIRAVSDQTADTWIGLFWAGAGLAGGAGALLAGALRTSGRERLVLAGGMVLTAIAAWPVAATFGLGGLASGLLLASFVAGPVDVGLLTLRQRRTDPAQLGRILSVSISLNVAGFPLGAAFAGLLVPLSLPGAFATACAASALGALAVRLIPKEPA